jgi:hypothetical protein
MDSLLKGQWWKITEYVEKFKRFFFSLSIGGFRYFARLCKFVLLYKNDTDRIPIFSAWKSSIMYIKPPSSQCEDQVYSHKIYIMTTAFFGVVSLLGSLTLPKTLLVISAKFMAEHRAVIIIHPCYVFSYSLHVYISQTYYATTVLCLDWLCIMLYFIFVLFLNCILCKVS